MENNISVGDYNVLSTTFPGGEVNVTIPEPTGSDVTVTANIANAEGIMQLMLVKDAIHRGGIHHNLTVTLLLPYVPYARQDRVCNPGEALSISVFCKMINSLKFDRVVILDPHSDVTPALIDNVTVVDQYYPIKKSPWVTGELIKNHTLVAPDAGSTKKMQQLCEKLAVDGFIQGHKKRNTLTGKLSGFGYDGDVQGKDLLIIDDICDGGGTFIGLAKELKAGGASSVKLWVSHGIFSKGVKHLLDNGIDHVYTTDSVISRESNESLTTVHWK